MSIPSWILCNEDGPSGGFAVAAAHVKGYCLGGPVGAFISSTAGGYAAGLATEKIIEEFTPKHQPENHTIEKRSVGINKKYLHRFRRRSAVSESIDHMYFRIKDVGGDKYMFLMYEGREIPVFGKPDDPHYLYVYHRCGPYNCKSSWQLTSEGNLKERNHTLNETWDWIREN